MTLFELHVHGPRHLTNIPIRPMQAHPVTKAVKTKKALHPHAPIIKPPKPRKKRQRTHF